MIASFYFQSSRLRLLISLCFLLTAICSFSCSVPNLEQPDCSAARQTVKEFYSFHFGNEMKPSNENLQKRERFLSEDLKRQLSGQTETTVDYFTATDDYPKAFRIGECTAENENVTIFQIVFFWKDDARSQQREIKAETIKENGKWLINRIF